MNGTDIWCDYVSQAMANIGPLKEAQFKLIALGVPAGEAGRILSGVHKAYVDAAFNAVKDIK